MRRWIGTKGRTGGFASSRWWGRRQTAVSSAAVSQRELLEQIQYADAMARRSVAAVFLGQGSG